MLRKLLTATVLVASMATPTASHALADLWDSKGEVVRIGERSPTLIDVGRHESLCPAVTVPVDPRTMHIAILGAKEIRATKCQIRLPGNGPRASESVVLVPRLATLTGPF
jgi:hypothetical protein